MHQYKKMENNKKSGKTLLTLKKNKFSFMSFRNLTVTKIFLMI
jgi:hypothetical protein